MSEELLQRGLINKPEKIGEWDFYNIGATTLTSLKQHGIIENIDYSPLEKRKPDAIIVSNKHVIVLIENKKPSEFDTETKRNKAIKKALKLANKLKSRILIVTDTTRSIWINPLTSEPILDEQGNPLNAVFDPNSQDTPKLITKLLNSLSSTNNQIRPLSLVDPLPLAQKVWQDLWSVSGATPENCLYTFVELFIFKYLSDLNVLKGFNSFDYLLKQFEENTPEEVLEYYADVIRKKIKELFPKSSVDNTTIINGTIFVSKDEKAVKGYSTVFKKILMRFSSFGSLENIDYDFKSKLFETFLKESISKKNWGQYFTPLKVVRAIVSMADIREGMCICDPACGVGKFLLEPILRDINRFYKIDEQGNLSPKIKLIGFDKGFDKDEQKTIILAKANMLIYMSSLVKEYPAITQQFAKLFNDTFVLKTNSILGTLSDKKVEEYDLILTNPPYVTSGSSNLKEEIKKSGLQEHYAINALGVEGLFIEWIVRALKPGGKAFIVVPDGIMNRTNDKKLRQFILDECILDAIISLPNKTFFTSMKKTYIMAITKKHDRSIVQTDPVFTYLVTEIGETLDVYRFPKDKNHLDSAVNLYNQFKGSKNFFSTPDKRCKIQPIEKFDPDTFWSVERWWSQEEKIKLGIVEEREEWSISELSEYLGEITSSIAQYQEILKEIADTKGSFQYKKVSLKDTNYFSLFIGERVVKRDMVNMNGTIPLYSANVLKPVGYIEKSNISDFSNDFVLWGIDGNFEFSIKQKGEIFATSDHCGAIRIKNEKILPGYLLYQLNEVKTKYGFDRGLRSSLKNMKKVEIDIPVDAAGEFDIVKQKEISDIYETIKDLMSTLISYQKKLCDVKVKII